MNRWRFSFVAIILLFLANALSQAQANAQWNAAEIHLALKKLKVLGSALYIAAHPDDENTAVLAYLSRERLVRTAYLSLTRGDGGQNLIGRETGDLLGVIRTQELLAARRIDGARQFFTRAIDFGYSKTPEETLEIWDREQVLSDMVWVIRRFRPDILITRFTPERGGHGHHRASAILALEAFQAAGDSSRFPEQLSQVDVWNPRRILWNAWKPALERQNLDTTRLPFVDLGTFNPLLGKSYGEISAHSRSMHKSQGFGMASWRGQYREYFQHLGGDSAVEDIFEGIDVSWKRVQGGEAVNALIDQTLGEFNPENPAALLPRLLEIYQTINDLPSSFCREIKLSELRELIQACSGMWLDARVHQFAVTPGDSQKITLEIINRSSYSLRTEKIHFPFTEESTFIGKELEYNRPLVIRKTVIVPPQAEYTRSFWLKSPHGEGMYVIPDQILRGEAQHPNPLVVNFFIGAGKQVLQYPIPLRYVWTDPVDGEKERALEILPKVTLNPDQTVYVFPDGQPREVKIRLKSRATNIAGRVSLNLPAEWKYQPPSIPFGLEEIDQETMAIFTVFPPEKAAEGTFSVVAEVAGQSLSFSLFRIEYDHIPLQTVLKPAEGKLVRLDLKKGQEKIGYIMGSGDDIPDYLSRLGYPVTLFSDEDLELADLSVYDVIIAGIRAYNTRPVLSQQQSRLLNFVKNGGTLILQYNTNRRLVTEQLGPYPFKISRDRVSDESAPVTILQPDHPLFTFPNQITPADFQGWVQERGLYFASEWADEYQPLLSCHDVGEEAKTGGMLFARFGKGVFIYSGYAWFRQLPAGVPGAYRLFVNMISAGKYDEQER